MDQNELKNPCIRLKLLVLLGLSVFFTAFSFSQFIKLSAGEKELAARYNIPQGLVLEIKQEAYTLMLPGSKNAEFSRLTGNDEEGNNKPGPGIVIKADQKKAEIIPDKFAQKAVLAGCFVFRSKQNFGIKEPDEIAIMKAKDQYDILRLMGTDGINYGITNQMVIKKMKAWEKKCSFRINGADFDWVSAVFIKQPADMDSFAKELYKFCPDVVDQGTGSVEALAKEMKDTNTLYMWWD